MKEIDQTKMNEWTNEIKKYMHAIHAFNSDIMYS